MRISRSQQSILHRIQHVRRQQPTSYYKEYSREVPLGIAHLSTITTSHQCFSTNSTSSLTTRETSALVPIDFETSSSIKGEESQILKVQLEPNQTLRAESGAMLYMTQGVEMSTSLGGSDTKNAISAGFKRMLTGQNMFLSDYTYDGEHGPRGTVALGTAFPSKIIRLSLPEYGNKIVCQKGAYLASSMDVQIEMEFAKKFTAGFFGGEGFVLQALLGDGDVFVKAGGTLVRRDLREGETLRISSGCLVAFTQDVEYDVQTMPGFKNVMFGGEGLFVTTLTGPGTVWLQGMPPDRMMSEIARRVPSGGIGLGIPIGIGGGGGDTTEGDNDGDGTSDTNESEADEDLVATSDAAVEADRNATVASSGTFDNDTIESESPDALFGDVASNSVGVSPHSNNGKEDLGENGDISNSMPDLDDATTFSSDTTQFGDDLTSENQFDDFDQDDTSFSTEDQFGSSLESDSGEEGSGISDIFRTIWDLFNDDE